jgi:hypothetical protein
MTNVPVPAQHDMVMQNQTTGAVDFLEFNGTQLVGSFMKNYGLSGWKIVASGDFNGDGHMDLVAQQQNGSGALDFLFLDGNANLIGSWNDNVFHVDMVLASDLLPGTIGSPTLFALNQDFSTFGADSNVFATIDGTHRETVEMVGFTSARQPDLLMFNSGYGDPAHLGDEVGTLLSNFTLSAGWQLVDAGPVAQEIFPLV